MEKKNKLAQKKQDKKSKKVAEDHDLNLNGSGSLESKFLAWKKKSKPLKQFPFLNNLLFSEFLNMDTTVNSANQTMQDNEHASSNLKNALKYKGVMSYIEQHSDSIESDALNHNIAFMYNVDKEALKKEVSSIKKTIKKAPKNTQIEQYLKNLIQQETPIEADTEDLGDGVEIIILSSPKSKSKWNSKKKREDIIEDKNDSKHTLTQNDEESKGKKTNARQTKNNGVTNKREAIVIEDPEQTKKATKGKNGIVIKIEDSITEDVHPIKKKIKENSSAVKEVIVDHDEKKLDDKRNDTDKKKKKKEKETKERKPRKKKTDEAESKPRKSSSSQTKRRKSKKEESESSIEDVQEAKDAAPEQFMELQINNDVDSDQGEGFSFFFVNENVFNKTKPYFEKKPRPEQICSCLGGCNDPTICPCARFNFDNCGKTSCYVYDPKYEKKRLLNPLIRKDMHIYECSSQCACNKGFCLNSCINEGNANKANITDLVVERYEKIYKGNEPNLANFSAKMWGLKAKAFLPANTYVVEYCGEIITKKEGDRRGEKYDSVNCNYLFDLNKHVEIEKVDHSNGVITLNIDGICETRNTSKLKDISENFPLVIDAFFYGNHSRFVNHSCMPNMVALAVHIENRNILLPRIIFFALRDIQPGEELTIDYNCAPLKDLKNTDQLVCLCGAEFCRGYVYEEGQDSDGETKQ